MSEHPDHTTAIPPQGPPPPYVETPSPPARVRRSLGVPVVAAIAAGTLLVGGLVGGIIGYAVHSDGPEFANQQDFGPAHRFRQGGPPDGQRPDRSQQQEGSSS
jgi:hypothetical protein